LTAEGRKAVLRAYERRLDTAVRHPVFGYRISYRRVLDVQARLMAAVLVGELPDYVPMVTR
jgi:CRISPR-associated protein Cas1